MLTTTDDAAPTLPAATPPRGWRVLAVVGLLGAGAILGAGGMWLADDPYLARTEHLVGTVTWSNQETRLVAFRADGDEQRRYPSKGDVFYSIIADNWEDAGGTVHGDSTYPTCLAEAADVHRRVELDVLHRATAGQHVEHVAVHVRCLD
ncbi:hypothetical protein [Asanoa siamensis]|uniref:Uncharacterized protein n=1 Tax=Asanoa siamensis TaxID=926357 RepID=A0ABQ4D0P8_9ACTN|nr:hypothetical protein [Asanoa siamensis]GIF77115.1 hypothetical protein Asi02nite_66330 [Asanoa siamensis]